MHNSSLSLKKKSLLALRDFKYSAQILDVPSYNVLPMAPLHLSSPVYNSQDWLCHPCSLTALTILRVAISCPSAETARDGSRVTSASMTLTLFLFLCLHFHWTRERERERDKIKREEYWSKCCSCNLVRNGIQFKFFQHLFFFSFLPSLIKNILRTKSGPLCSSF